MDLISREDAIDVCNCAIDLWEHCIGQGALVAVKEKIEELPSVEVGTQMSLAKQDVIDAIVAWTVEDRPDIEMPTDLVDRVNALPSAEPHWIPCSERLPEDYRCAVLVYEKNYNNIYTAYYDSVYGWMTFNPCIDDCFPEHLNIVAWMPLPPAYEGSAE